MNNFGGNWTEKKLDAFVKYVIAYLTILNKYKTQYNWQTIYFDGFAGSGKRTIYKDEDLFSQNVLGEDEDEFFIYEGSVSKILKLEHPFIFDWYYFIDSNRKYILNLKDIRASINHINEERIIIREDNCNSQIIKLAEGLKNNRNLASLIFLDPFGMQIDWSSIKELKGTRSDVWILIPSGVGINRLLDKKKRLNHKDKLECFFGLPISELENIFYKSRNDDTLFGVKEITSKIDNSIDKIVEIYCQQLKTVWKFVTEKPLVLTNSRNSPIFHLLFASNNKTALKIASEIIDKG